MTSNNSHGYPSLNRPQKTHLHRPVVVPRTNGQRVTSQGSIVEPFQTQSQSPIQGQGNSGSLQRSVPVGEQQTPPYTNRGTHIERRPYGMGIKTSVKDRLNHGAHQGIATTSSTQHISDDTSGYEMNELSAGSVAGASSSSAGAGNIQRTVTPRHYNYPTRALDNKSKSNYAVGMSDSKVDHSGGEFKQKEHSGPSARFTEMEVDDVIQTVGANVKEGLTYNEVTQRQLMYGRNEMPKEVPDSVMKQFLAQFYENPLILLLLGSVAISIMIGNYDDAFSIILAVLIVITVGFVQEQRSQKALDALNELVPPSCTVIRNNGTAQPMAASDVVIGDTVIVRTGDRVPADCRIVECKDLQVDESSLTGETEPVSKTTSVVVNAQPQLGSVPVNERNNILYMGTLVRQGTGRAVVIGTGAQTEFGQIFTMMQGLGDRKTPLQTAMNDLAHKLSVASFIIIGCICVVGWLQSRSWLDMFTIGVSLAVAAIPEGLPIVVSVTLALGVHRMAKQHVIVKKLPSIEALGSVSIVCSDKTGTITMNQMEVTHAYTLDDGAFSVDEFSRTMKQQQIALGDIKTTLFQGGSLVSHAERGQNSGEFIGQATDIALVKVLEPMKLRDRRSEFTVVSSEPFSSDRKYQSVTGYYSHDDGSSHVLGHHSRPTTYTVGAIEMVLPLCRSVLRSSSTSNSASTPTTPTPMNFPSNGTLGAGTVAAALDMETSSKIHGAAESLAQNGLRIIAVAVGTDPNALSFVGLLALIDPPRRGVAQAISTLMASGVRVAMITGDSAQTASAICKQVNIPVTSHTTLTGRDIDTMTDRQLVDAASNTLLFARVTPRHKLRIVEAMQANRMVVAMTGDGVNDAPALKQADIGLSMGLSGTDVAKEASDIILVLDNLATLVPAFEEGKTIFLNVQNFLAFQLSTAVATLTLIFLSTVLGLPNPLNAMQILFINILMDGPPSQSLGVDPISPRIARRPPRPRDQSVLSRQLIIRILYSAALVVAGVLMVYGIELSEHHLANDDLNVGQTDLRHQTMTFTAFVLLDLVSAVQNRGVDVNLFSGNVNKMLLATVSISLLVQFIIVYVPFAQSIFHTEALALKDLLAVIGLAGVSFGLHELRRNHEAKLADQEFVSRSTEVV